MDRSALTPTPSRLCERQALARGSGRKVSGRNRNRNRSGFRSLLRLTIAGIALALISLSAFFVNSYRSYAGIVDARLARGYLISRAGIYAAPRTLRPGQKL